MSVALCALIVAGCAQNTSPPTISGTTVDGSTLTANPGSWTWKGTISFTYQWVRCDTSGGSCQGVSGATGTTYLLTPSDVGSTIRVVVTGTDADGPQGASGAISGQTAVIAALKPHNSTLPSITGTTKAGQTLSASQGSWTGTPPLSFGYQWERCNASGNSCHNVGTDASTYPLGSGDVGSTIRVVVTATNGGGFTAATSVASAVIGLSHDPVVVAVGDIACAPGDTTNDCQQGATANLASAQGPDAVLTLGDNQYNAGLLSEYTGAGAYGATWGDLQPDRVPRPWQSRVHVQLDRGGLLRATSAPRRTAPPPRRPTTPTTWVRGI